MSNEYFNESGAPSTGSPGTSSTQRAEFSAIRAGFDKLPTMTANADLPIFVNTGATALVPVTASQARTKLGLAIGTNVQAYNADLAAIAGLTSAADKLPYATGAGTWAVTAFTAAARTLIAGVDAAAMRTTLSLGNVDNTSDANKPVSTAQQTALNAKAAKGANSDITSLTGLTDMPMFGAFLNGAQTTSASNQIIQNSFEDFDTHNAYDNTTYTFTAPIAGKYHFDVGVAFGTISTSGVAIIELLLNGSPLRRAKRNIVAGESDNLSISCIFDLVVNDTVAVRSTGSTAVAALDTLNRSTHFSGCRVR